MLLAAGGSTRFGETNKVLHEYKEVSFLRRAISTAQAADVFDNIFVVTGYESGRVAQHIAHANVAIVNNSRWNEGVSSSIKAGIRAAWSEGYDVALIMPVDMPHLTSATLGAIARAVDSEHSAACAAWGDYRGVPAAFRLAIHYDDFMALTGDCGAKSILRCVTQLRVLTVDPIELRDMDRIGQ